MGGLLIWGFIFFGPALCFGLFFKGWAWLNDGDNAWHRYRRKAPAGADLGRLTADLRRLRLELDALSRSNEPLRATRLRAVGLAYDDVLCACCLALELPAGPPPLDGLARIEAEATLAKSGINW